MVAMRARVLKYPLWQFSRYSPPKHGILWQHSPAGTDVNTQGRSYGNALQATSFGGHDRTVELLLNEGADVNAQGGHSGDTLQTPQRHDRAVELLLSNGVNINAQGGMYGNALQAASLGGHDLIVELLTSFTLSQCRRRVEILALWFQSLTVVGH